MSSSSESSPAPSPASSEPVGVVGVGWVGLVTAACFAAQGHEVWAMDIDAAKIASLSAGELTIHEPDLPELVRANSGRLHFTTEMAELLGNVRLIFCCVDTPPTYSGDADLSRVRAVVEQLDDDSEHALVMKSTVPAGTGDSIRRDMPSLSYVSCPEFLKEGSAVSDFLHPDRVVIGSDPGDEWAAEAVAGLYEPLGGALVHTDVSSAEMIKLASNAFLATKISFINEIANVCEEVGADVTEVARGMGLDQRIGKSFLNAGIGYGGSCLTGEETVLVRSGRQVALKRLDDLFAAAAIRTGAELVAEVVEPEDLEVLSDEGGAAPVWRHVSALTSRAYEGRLLEVQTATGHRLRCTPDHPFVTVDPASGLRSVVLASDLSERDWLPVASGPLAIEPSSVALSVAGAEAGSRPGWRVADAARLDQALDLRIPLSGAAAADQVPFDLELDEDFWRVAGLYLGRGRIGVDGPRGRHEIHWSFAPEEAELTAFVTGFWSSRGIEAEVSPLDDAECEVTISCRRLAAWWADGLGAGIDVENGRVPDLAYSQPPAARRALLWGAWRADGSRSPRLGAPGLVLEYETPSRTLADGLGRLLLAEGIVASSELEDGGELHRLRISGAAQVERATGFLVSGEEQDAIRAAIAWQSRRPRAEERRSLPGGGTAVRISAVERSRFAGRVFSMEVPGTETFAATAGLVTHNCFPKDVTALKQLAGNTGYHFQLLNAVIEVNELQKRRVLGKLNKHLGSLVGKRIALLGLAFKPDTDDMREASSLVLAARLQGEGATVVAYDPVATEAAGGLLPAVEMASSAAAALEGADAAVLVTEWGEFSELDWPAIATAMRGPVIVDGRNYLDPATMREAGFTYEGIGRGN